MSAELYSLVVVLISEIPLKMSLPAPRYRSSEAMPDDRIRDFARNWAPEMRRTPNGYMKARSNTITTDVL